ncbi:Cthe_2314 family HEPN domain-containing protein [Pseudomonas asplenii]|uniref:Cthe_2314 family HEPN domain-containing protein n=1 Tax=Pseudomonas asplenii TaxID=53407 RepID=UPI0037CC53BB
MPIDDLLVASQSLKEHAGLRCMHPHFHSYAIRALEEINIGDASVNANALEYFAQAVLGRVDELDNSLASLYLAHGFIKELSLHHDPRVDTYRYHYENFVFRGIGAVDRAYLLVAEALQLSKSARKNNVQISKYAEQKPEVYAALEDVKATFEPYRKPRNVIIHDSEYSNRELGILAGARHFGVDCERFDISALARESFALKADEILKVLIHLAYTLRKLLSTLQPVFESKVGNAEKAINRKHSK